MPGLAASLLSLGCSLNILLQDYACILEPERPRMCWSFFGTGRAWSAHLSAGRAPQLPAKSAACRLVASALPECSRLVPAAKLLQRALCTLPLVEHAAPLARRRASEGAASDMLALAGAVLPACSTTGRHLCNAMRPVRSHIRL